MSAGALMLAALLLGAITLPSHAQSAAQVAPDRARLEGDIRRGFARAVRQRVGLSDEQMRRLGPVTQRHEQQRRQLQQDERRTRIALQQAIRDSSTDSAAISGHLQALVSVQQRRVQLLEAEQRDLAAIMTPLQRAKYMAVQEQVRRRLEQMRQRRAPMPEGEGLPPRRGRPPS